jgi:hypothetical protein
MAVAVERCRRRDGLEAAVNGGADAIVTFNHADFKGAPKRFGIQLWKPVEALRDLRK